MIRRISAMLGSRLRMVAAAVAGAIALAGCANLPDESAGTAAAPAPAPVPAAAPARPASAPAVSAPPPTKTINLPDRGRVSLSEYRARMREQLMKTENANSDVADCAAHASWVVPRSATYDALKIPTGALATGQASTEPWSGRFSPGKQAVPVSSVVTFAATAHKRQGSDDWQPVKVRCGYDDGMMLAYELLDSSGATISEPAAAPAVPTATRTSASKSRKGAKGKSTAPKSGKASTSKSVKSSSAKSTSAKSTSSSAKAGSKSKQKQ
ncbi:BspC domain-containing protein [Cupriavidus taiwanensis]|uniref:BspC domain-containing protein n=1 Tax=Cupriavidus taiwanensis TaxID=164546 RepID=UPI00358E98C2